MFERRFWTRVLAGKSGQVFVNPDTPHTYHFIPDVAAGLAALGRADDAACGRCWMLPCAPAVTTRELVGSSHGPWAARSSSTRCHAGCSR